MVVAFVHPLELADTTVVVEDTKVVVDTSVAAEELVDTTVVVVDTSDVVEAAVVDTSVAVEAVVVDTSVAVEDTSVAVEDTSVAVQFVDTMDFADNDTVQDKLDAGVVFEPAVEDHSEPSTEQDQEQHLFDTPSTIEHTLRMNEQIRSNYSRND